MTRNYLVVAEAGQSMSEAGEPGAEGAHDPVGVGEEAERAQATGV